MPPLRIVIAPSGFKESLSAEEVAEAIASGVHAACPGATIALAPLVDGGEGTTRTLVNVTGGTLYPCTVTGPVGTPVQAQIGILGGSGPATAVLEIASAAGLRLVPADMRDPGQTTTYGVGELIHAALDLGVERILVGCGDSGTNDGGAGMAEALGARLLDANGNPIGRGGSALRRLAWIDRRGLDPRLNRVQIDVACNMHNLLCGPNGVARVFGPQKGASPEQVEQLAGALDQYAAIIRRDTGLEVRQMAGGGASGGLGSGLYTLLGAQLYNRYELVMRYLNFDKLLSNADLVITAEGGIDNQTPYGKIPAEVARRARVYGVPVIALAGTIGQEARVNYDHGIAAYCSILQRPCTINEAIAQAARLTAECAENVLRMLLAGQQLNQPTMA